MANDSANEAIKACHIGIHPTEARMKGIREMIAVKAGDNPSMRAT